MPIIRQQDLKDHLAGIGEAQIPTAYLIFGEPFLCRRALEMVLKRLLPEGKGFDYEPLDGTVADAREAVQKAATFSLFSEKKVVALLDARVFLLKADSEALLKKAKESYETEEMRNAARYFLAWMAASRIDFDALSETAPGEADNGGRSFYENETWMEPLVRYCRETGLSVPDVKSDAVILEDAIQRGFPGKNTLILTTDRVDRRLSLFQSIAEKGMVIDCSVPTGNTASEKKAREAILKACVWEILQARKKTIESDAYAAVCEMTGFELPVLIGNLEKLIAYTGKRSRITVQDVQTVLSRTKEDPVFELTGAVMDRNAEKALFFLDSLLKADFHPIAVLSALVNQVRKLIAVKEFTGKEPKAAWRKGCDFRKFKEDVIPGFEAHEKQIEKAVTDWERNVPDPPASGGGKKKGKEDTSTDRVLAKGGANAYPVFKLFQSSNRFEKDELIQALVALRDADRLLKSTPLPPRLLLEKVILAICKQENGPAVPAKGRK